MKEGTTNSYAAIGIDSIEFTSDLQACNCSDVVKMLWGCWSAGTGNCLEKTNIGNSLDVLLREAERWNSGKDKGILVLICWLKDDRAVCGNPHL